MGQLPDINIQSAAIEEITITPAANVTLNTNYTNGHKCGKFVEINIFGKANANINNQSIATWSGASVKKSAVIGVGISTEEWNVTSIAYGYIGSNNFNMRLNNGEWFHIHFVALCD